MSIEGLDQLFSEAGNLAPGIEAIARTGDEHWTIKYGDDEIDIEYNPADSGLMLFAELGTPDPALAFELYEAVLMVSLLWRETGGMRVALDRSGGNLILLFGFNTLQLEAQGLATVLERFAANAKVFRSIVRRQEPLPNICTVLNAAIRV